MAETKISFDRLSDANWTSWRFRMELMLMKEDLWTTVKDVKPAPEDMTSAWSRKDEKARAMIGLALEDSQLSLIMEATNANEMWMKLKCYHERGSLSNKIHVLRKLCMMRLDESGSMSDHLKEVSEHVHRLARMGEAVKEHLVVAIVLSSLPESYNPLVTALEGRPEEDLKLEYIKGKLLDEWRRKREVQTQKSATEQVMKSIVPLESRRNVRMCHHCKEVSHLWRNCPVLQQEMEVNVKKQLGGTKTVVVQHPHRENNSESGEVCFTTRTGKGVTNSGKWIIDTGCTKHMTGSVEDFVSRIWQRKLKVTLADGRTVNARGSGEGKIVGRGLWGESIDMKLKELLYVPGLSGSVLSVSRITDQGYSVVFGPTDCQILDGSTVIAVGKKCEGLYYLTQ